MTIKSTPMAERFWRFVNKSEGCWEWTGYTATNGYGTIQRNHAPVLAHRASWEIANGAVPAGMSVLHKCDNRRCVNPSHLWVGTQAQNMADMVAKGRSMRGAKCGRRKLTSVQADEVKLHVALGTPTPEIARKYCISRTAVYNIISGKCWKGDPIGVG